MELINVNLLTCCFIPIDCFAPTYYFIGSDLYILNHSAYSMFKIKFYYLVYVHMYVLIEYVYQYFI